jgi:hypothetical protein
MLAPEHCGYWAHSTIGPIWLADACQGSARFRARHELSEIWPSRPRLRAWYKRPFVPSLAFDRGPCMEIVESWPSVGDDSV